MEIEEVKKEITKILQEELKNSTIKAFFFGSRVLGTAQERSDLDVGIESVNPIPKEVFYKIKSRLESIPTLYTIDLVDFALISEDFRKVAKVKIEQIV